MKFEQILICSTDNWAGAADIHLTPSEVADIDNALDNMEMTEVFGGSKITK